MSVEVEARLLTTEIGRTLVLGAGASATTATIFLHGSGPGATASSNWRFALPVLGGDRYCIAVELFGFGGSEHPASPPSGVSSWMDLWTRQVLEVMDCLGIERADLVGNSMGGAVSLHLLHRAPERFAKAVLMGSGGAPHAMTEALERAWGFLDDPTTAHMADLLRFFVHDVGFFRDDLQEIASERLAAATRPDVRRSYASMFPAPRQDHVDALVLPDDVLAGFEHPALLIHGNDDRIVPLDGSRYLLDRITKARLSVVRKCGHWVQVEQRDQFHKLLTDFLDDSE